MEDTNCFEKFVNRGVKLSIYLAFPKRTLSLGEKKNRKEDVIKWRQISLIRLSTFCNL